MAQDDVKSHLDKGLYGTPLVNPEERSSGFTKGVP